MRSDVEQGQLRGCPLCGTPVADANIGLRDFKWLNDALPGRIGGMDIDLILTNNKAGLAMAFELKPVRDGVRDEVSYGAKLTLKFLAQHGIRSFVVWDLGEKEVEFVELAPNANNTAPLGEPTEMSQIGFARYIAREMEFVK